MLKKICFSVLVIAFLAPLLGSAWTDWSVRAKSLPNVAAQAQPSQTAFSSTATPGPEMMMLLGGVEVAQNQATLPPLTPTAIIRLDVRSQPVLYAFIRAPGGIVAEPYVILSAYRSIPVAGGIQIRGRIGNGQFRCTETPCRVPVAPGTQIIFQAEDNFGGMSSEVRATVHAEQREGGYAVSLDQVSQFFAQRDACSAMWGFRINEASAPWNEFPQQPELLATAKTLHYLAGQLIRYKIVNADDCPGKGFDRHGAPNLCGLERAQQAMIAWQNTFDFDIWLAAKDVQIPPRILKVLIEKESQFWPTNERGYVDEFGLGQVNQLGIDVLLRNNPALYHQICPSVLTDCSVPYPALPESLQRMIRGALLNSINAYCPTCPNTLDLNVARQSLTMISLLLRANCQQIANVMDLYDAKASYEDHWKFTIMAYHSGLSCVENAVEELDFYNEPTDWKHVARKTDCAGAADYVDRFWTSLETFDQVRLPPDDGAGASLPVFLPTPTPIPTFGPPPSLAEIWVIVILDENRNGVPEESEWVDGIPVTLINPDGTERTLLTTNGKAIFDMKGYITGTTATIVLPNLYRTSTVVLPERGVVPVVFVFFPPPLTPQTP